jgi:pterin-4a-carbinolamine dehydratase
MTDNLRDLFADTLAHHPACNLKDEGYSAEDMLRMADALIQAWADLNAERWKHHPDNKEWPE